LSAVGMVSDSVVGQVFILRMTIAYVQCRWYGRSTQHRPSQRPAAAAGAGRQAARYCRLGLVHWQPTVQTPVMYRRPALLARWQRSQRHSVGGTTGRSLHHRFIASVNWFEKDIAKAVLGSGGGNVLKVSTVPYLLILLKKPILKSI